MRNALRRAPVPAGAPSPGSRFDDPGSVALWGAFGLLALIVGILAGVNPLLALAVSLGFAFVLVVLNDLAAGVVLFVFVTFLEVLPLGANPTVSGIKLVGLILGASWIGVIASRQQMGEAIELIKRHPAFTTILLLFGAWCVISVGWAQDAPSSQTAILRIGLNFALFFIFITALTERRQFVWVFWAFVVGAVVSAGYGLTQSQDFDVEGRLSGAGTNANDLAAVLVAAMVLSASLVAWHKRAPLARIAAIGIAAICAVFVFMTLSRAGLLSLGAVLVVALLVASRNRGRVFVVALVVIATVVGYFAFLAPDEARERVTTVGSGSGRTDLWTLGWRMVEDEPVTGVGIANFAPASVNYILQPGAIDTRYVITDAGPTVGHNIYLETLAEVGVVGLALFLLVLAIPLWSALKAARNFARDEDWRSEALARALFLAQTGMLAAAFFASIQYSKQLWILLALGPALLAVSVRGGPHSSRSR